MIKPFIPAQYVAGPDVNTGEREMGWIVESLKNRKVATGKPSLMGGLPHELGSTGFGVAKATQVASQLLGLDLRQTRVAIEGFGNVGSFAFKFLTEMGATIVAVSDSRATAYLATGLSYQTLLKLKKKGHSTGDYPQATKMERTAILGLPVDILILATVTDVIDEENKSEVKAKLIVEGSNIPMSEKIEEELFQRGILVVPDLIANAGGVISSYAEYQGYNPKKMFALVDTKITTTTTQVLRKALQQKINPRSLAMNIALKRLKR
jgi:glutamate dehydrogenase (NAD(P)+)